MQQPPAIPPCLLPYALTALGRGQRVAVLALAAVISLGGASLFLMAVYPAIFHSDSAVHYLLARAMVEEGSLLPHDFAYGNQLILWRNNLFIAPVLALGVQGYGAYAIGSAASIVVWFGIAFLAIESLLHDWRRSLLACTVLFIPFGHTEADFLLGEQSHIGAVVMSLVIVIQCWRALQGRRGAIAIAAAMAILMALEAPTRTLMMLLPLAVVLVATDAAAARRLAVPLLSAVIAGAALNRWLVSSHLVTGIPAMPLAAYAHFVARANELLKGLVDYFIGFYQFEGAVSRAGYLLLYAVKTAALIAFGVLAAWSAIGLARLGLHRAPDQSAASAVAFLGRVGVLGAALGFWVVCAVEYWLDVRHFLWALVVLKLALILAAMQAATRVRRPLAAYIALAFLTVLCSTAAMSLAVPGWRARLHAEAASHARDAMLPRIGERMHALGIRRIYGDFWTTLRLEALVPQAEAATLVVEDGQVKFPRFLARPSRECVQGPVLYQLDRGVPMQVAIIAALERAGGRLDTPLAVNNALYVGPPIWDQAHCR